MRTLTRVAALVLLVPAMLVSCGGDDDDGGGDAVPAAQFAETVNALCKDRDADAEALFEEHFTSEEPSDEELQAIVEGFIPIIEDYRAGVADAGPPEGLEDAYEEYLDLIDETLAKFEAAVGDTEKANALFEEEDDPRFAELEREMDLTDCLDDSEGA